MRPEDWRERADAAIYEYRLANINARELSERLTYLGYSLREIEAEIDDNRKEHRAAAIAAMKEGR